MSDNRKTFWLRSESKKNEFRRALTPNNCQEILSAGHQVIVEDWSESIIPTQLYHEVGCKIMPAGSWMNEAPTDAIIVGLKALPDEIPSFRHTHVYFAHCYKEQDGWKELMSKFHNGGGKIIDLEFMLDENDRRTNAFGYWAGYVGAALGALFSKSHNLDKSIKELIKHRQFKDKKDLINFVIEQTSGVGEAIVIGCNGRSGTGATDFLTQVNWSTMGWDQKDTSVGGPFKEILNYDLFVNCVLAMSPMAPFITKELIEKNNIKLNMISDVSCDPDSDCNMVPLYEEATVLERPIINVVDGDLPVNLTAIDNLPSILPKESSYDFSSQLAPYFVSYNEKEGPMSKALNYYNETLRKLN